MAGFLGIKGKRGIWPVFAAIWGFLGTVAGWIAAAFMAVVGFIGGILGAIGAFLLGIVGVTTAPVWATVLVAIAVIAIVVSIIVAAISGIAFQWEVGNDRMDDAGIAGQCLCTRKFDDGKFYFFRYGEMICQHDWAGGKGEIFVCGNSNWDSITGLLWQGCGDNTQPILQADKGSSKCCCNDKGCFKLKDQSASVGAVCPDVHNVDASHNLKVAVCPDYYRTEAEAATRCASPVAAPPPSSGPAGSAEDCTNGVDDNSNCVSDTNADGTVCGKGDDGVDCRDTFCNGKPGSTSGAAFTCESVESTCNDGMDNDEDGKKDCDDSDCETKACVDASGKSGTCQSGSCKEPSVVSPASGTLVSCAMMPNGSPPGPSDLTLTRETAVCKCMGKTFKEMKVCCYAKSDVSPDWPTFRKVLCTDEALRGFDLKAYLISQGVNPADHGIA